MTDGERKGLIRILQRNEVVPEKYRDILFPPAPRSAGPLVSKLLSWLGFQVLLPLGVVGPVLFFSYFTSYSGRDLFDHVVRDADLMLIGGLLLIGAGVDIHFIGGEVRSWLKDTLFTLDLLMGISLLVAHSSLKAHALEKIGQAPDRLMQSAISWSWICLLIAIFLSVVSITGLEAAKNTSVRAKNPKHP